MRLKVSSLFLVARYRTGSSAYCLDKEFFMLAVRSLTFVKNSIGPRMLPSGTPQEMLANSERLSLARVHCFRFER